VGSANDGFVYGLCKFDTMIRGAVVEVSAIKKKFICAPVEQGLFDEGC
jgi:hypothetical protein